MADAYCTVYQVEKGKKTYFGLARDKLKKNKQIKQPYSTASFRDKNKQNATELNKYIWSLINSLALYSISWKTVVAHAKLYSIIATLLNNRIYT